MLNKMKHVFTEIEFGRDFDARIGIADVNGNNKQTLPMHSFTDNFLNYIRYMVFGYSNPGRNVIDANGYNTLYSIVANFKMSLYPGSYLTHTAQGIILGTGAPTRSAAMVALGTPLDGTSLEVPASSLAMSYVADASGSVITTTKAFKNITANPITITEIALSRYIASNSVWTYAIFSHDIFDPGVTLAAGETKVFSIEMTFANTVPETIVKLIMALFDTFATTSLKAITGSYVTTTIDSYYIKVPSAFEYATYGGVYVGSDATPPYYTDYKVTKVGTRVGTPAYDTVKKVGADTYADFTGIFVNYLATPIVVNEVGVYNGYSTSIFMFLRTVLAAPITLNQNDVLGATIRLKTVFT